MTITESESFSHLVTVKRKDGSGLDLTGFGIESQVRARSKTGTVVFEFTIIPVDLTNGKFRIELSSEETANNFFWGVGVWDVFFTYPDGVRKKRTAEQKITIKRGVTRQPSNF